MPKKIRVDFVKSISKFKKSDLKKSIGEINLNNKLKCLEILIAYKNQLQMEYPENIQELINAFYQTLVSIYIPIEFAEELKNNEEFLIKYFVLYNRYKRLITNKSKIDSLNLTEKERTLAAKILTEFYDLQHIQHENNFLIVTPVKL